MRSGAGILLDNTLKSDTIKGKVKVNSPACMTAVISQTTDQIIPPFPKQNGNREEILYVGLRNITIKIKLS
jgi:hypothetical protein